MLVSSNSPNRIRSPGSGAGEISWRCSEAARGASPAAIRLREFQTGTTRLRASARALSNQAASERRWAARSKYAPANTFLLRMAGILAGHPMLVDAAERGSKDRRLAIGATRPALRQQIAQPHAAAIGAARDSQLIAPRQREQQEPSVLERDARGGVQFEVSLVNLAQQGARFERADSIARLEPHEGAPQQPVHHEQARELRRLKIQFGSSEEKGRLARGFAAMPLHRLRVVAHHVAAVELAYPIVAQAGPLADRMGARFVADQAQRQVQALPVAGITVVGHSHGRLLMWRAICEIRAQI